MLERGGGVGTGVGQGGGVGWERGVEDEEKEVGEVDPPGSATVSPRLVTRAYPDWGN